MIAGETILSGAPLRCPDCQQEPRLGVYESAAGWYIGTCCGCGPYTRESRFYYPTQAAAQRDLERGEWLPRG